jgi:hypothetical protein
MAMQPPFEDVRKVGKYSCCVSIPKEIIQSLGWCSRQKLVVGMSGDNIVIRDRKGRDPNCATGRAPGNVRCLDVDPIRLILETDGQIVRPQDGFGNCPHDHQSKTQPYARYPMLRHIFLC